jgi:hypothetical protein
MKLYDIQKSISDHTQMLFKREIEKRFLGKTISTNAQYQGLAKRRRNGNIYFGAKEWEPIPVRLTTIKNIQKIEASCTDNIIMYTDENGRKYKSHTTDDIKIVE